VNYDRVELTVCTKNAFSRFISYQKSPQPEGQAVIKTVCVFVTCCTCPIYVIILVNMQIRPTIHKWVYKRTA